MYNFITQLISIVFYKRSDHGSDIYLGVASLKDPIRYYDRLLFIADFAVLIAVLCLCCVDIFRVNL